MTHTINQGPYISRPRILIYSVFIMTHMIIQGRGDSFIEQKLSGGDLSRV